MAWIGPVAVLAALLFSLAAQRVWDRLIGEASCRWRLPYFPDARVYAIGPAHLRHDRRRRRAAAAGARAARRAGRARLGDQSRRAGASLCAGAWVIAFDREDGCNFWLAALLLAAGAGSGVAALAVEEAWHRAPASPVRAAAIATTTPLALLAGWMLVACALNVGIAVRASGGGPPDIDCPARLRRASLAGAHGAADGARRSGRRCAVRTTRARRCASARPGGSCRWFSSPSSPRGWRLPCVSRCSPRRRCWRRCCSAGSD